jgi:hypothetical protein
VPPCLDIYAWIEPEHRQVALERFIERYVDTESPGDPRLEAFLRVHVHGNGSAADLDELAELQRADDVGDAFSLYVHARGYEFAILTVTKERAVVLGLSLDDPDDSTDVLAEGTELLRELCREYSARAGLAGVEVPPPQSWPQWTSEPYALVRLGPLDFRVGG